MASTSPSPQIKQENNAKSLSSAQETQSSLPPNVRHSPQNQDPVVSPPTNEDLWHLPGRLRINPSLWDKEDVAHWLHWAHKEYSLQRAEKTRFEMNGRALCLLTKEDFRRRCPSSGDVLYEILQCVKQHRRSVVCETPKVGTSGSEISCQVPPGSLPEQQSLTVRDTSVSALATSAVSAAFTATVSSPTETLLPPRNHLTLVSYSVFPAFSNGSAVVSVAPNNQLLCLPQTESSPQEPLNLSSRERPRSPLHKANGRIPKCRLLWDYVYQLLCDDRYRDYIRWEDEDSLIFRVVDPNGLARLWGNHKNRENMTYEKMSRALRHYYKLNIIKKERGQKLLFRFLKLPQDIREQQGEAAVSPDRTPPPDELSDDHFEVSPDRSSPQPPTSAPVT
ncbi:Transcription factor ETV7 [Oryzias melastigma]|uniref:Transcription factor ETV6 n=1 Tax=Oryzias melastigma TaxID=30732 RepID=A0A3B3DKH8_ORYME|nr:transcription factor ETV7 [Oryzias melastigma]XP_024148875.1 transcription factor ETV7 [Oryzias melastigma]KAF6719677.1 Transcription factor ETV7 [Oryzias melastigma]